MMMTTTTISTVVATTAAIIATGGVNLVWKQEVPLVQVWKQGGGVVGPGLKTGRKVSWVQVWKLWCR